MGFMDFMFGKSEELKPKVLQEPYQITGRKGLYEAAEPGALERMALAGQPFPGELTAPMTGAEEYGYEDLMKYLKSPMPTEGGLWGMAKGEMEKTLGGEEYDPLKGAYYQAYRTNLEREVKKAQDAIAARTSARDAFYGGGRISEERELQETAMGNITQTLGALQEAERERRLGAVPEAMRMTAYEEMEPLTRIGAAKEYGAGPREWEQSRLDREYQEFMRQLTDLGIPLETAMQLSMYKPEMYYPSYSHTAGLLGGPTGVSQQPSGGWGDPQRVQAGLAAIAQLLSGMKGA